MLVQVMITGIIPEDLHKVIPETVRHIIIPSALSFYQKNKLILTIVIFYQKTQIVGYLRFKGFSFLQSNSFNIFKPDFPIAY